MLSVGRRLIGGTKEIYGGRMKRCKRQYQERRTQAEVELKKLRTGIKA